MNIYNTLLVNFGGYFNVFGNSFHFILTEHSDMGNIMKQLIQLNKIHTT